MIIEDKEQKTPEGPQVEKKIQPLPIPTASDGTLANAVIRIEEMYEALRRHDIMQ